MLALIDACNREVSLAHPRADLPIRTLVWSTLASASSPGPRGGRLVLTRDDGSAAGPLKPVTRFPHAQEVEYRPSSLSAVAVEGPAACGKAEAREAQVGNDPPRGRGPANGDPNRRCDHPPTGAGGGVWSQVACRRVRPQPTDRQHHPEVGRTAARDDPDQGPSQVSWSDRGRPRPCHPAHRHL